MMKRRNNKLLKIDKETHSKIKELKREMSLLEQRDLSMAEITRRVFGNTEILGRLKLGSKERRMGLK